MRTSPAKKVARTAARQEETSVPAGPELELALADLGHYTLREVLGEALSSLARGERSAYLDRVPDDKGNGSYGRFVNVGSVPVPLDVPRTRTGGFRPTLLPERYQRGYPEEAHALVLGLLASCRSVNAAKEGLRKMGLSVSEGDLEVVAKEFVEELQLRNTRPVDPDLLALFIDGKYVEVRDGEQLRPCCIYVAVGLGRDGKKRILAAQALPGRENLDDWKKMLRGLLERGLRRVLIVVQDDFSGLLPITKGLFPTAEVQLCIVHMQRNAKIHLGREEAVDFMSRIRAIKACWDPAAAALQFDELCNHHQEHAPAFVAELRKKRDHYLAFLAYPEAIRRSLSTTNVVEAVNGQLERLRRNNGGYFHNETVLRLKLGMAISFLEEGTWRRTAHAVEAALSQMNALFERRFEGQP